MGRNIKIEMEMEVIERERNRLVLGWPLRQSNLIISMLDLSV